MRVYLAIVLFACSLTAALAVRCAEQADCDASKCCAGLPFFGGICRNFTPVGQNAKLLTKSFPCLEISM
ncbi:hypothetical protein CEXT_318121 [Caerostris extrusa]|uniref:Uncharacterized protein n=1 Tax=Caerostris extrusa TaxID=172846 RepID=A0AAV4Y9L4_CAEEX|nr:hypothetical protein CEXT_318121 [Caerostris extrusa]